MGRMNKVQGAQGRDGELRALRLCFCIAMEGKELLNLLAAQMSGTLVLDSMAIIALKIGMLAFQTLK